MRKIANLSQEFQDFWTDVISKYIEMNLIRDDESIYQQKNISKDKINKGSSYSMNKSYNNVMTDFEGQRNLVINLKNKINELIMEKNNLMNIIDKKEKEIKEKQKIIGALNQKNQEIIKNKENKIINLEKLTTEYKAEIQNLKIIINENKNISINEKQIKEENINLKDKLMKLINENIVLKTYKEYKLKYESLLQKKDGNKNSNYNLENITETKEKLLAALKSNVGIQKENERLRKEILTLKEELKKEKKENNINNSNINEKEDINYKLEYEKLNIKTERYKYLLDNKDKQIEKLEKDLEKYKNLKSIGNRKLIKSNNIYAEKNNNFSSEIDINDSGNNTNNSNKNSEMKINSDNANSYHEKIKNKIIRNNTDSKVYSFLKINSSKTMNKNTLKEEKNKTNTKIKKSSSKSQNKKERLVNRKKEQNNNNNNITNISFKNNVNPNSSLDFSKKDNLFNSILNLNSSIKINNNINLAEFLEKLNTNNNSNTKITTNKSINSNNVSKIQKNLNSIKSLLDNVYSNLKKNKKNHMEFITFIYKINKEFNLNIFNEEQIKELKKELNQLKRKDSDNKLKLTFLQSEKIKLEEENQRLQEELKKLNAKTPNKEKYDIPMIKKNYLSSKKADSFINLNVNSELGRLTMNIINNSPNKKEKESESSEKGIKYSFKKKRLINKSPSLERGTAFHYKKLFSGEKNSMSIFEDESNEINNENEGNNNEIMTNNEMVEDLKNKINDLTNDKNCLEDKVKNLNELLENMKVKENNIEKINSSLIKENIDLKQSLLLIKENNENEFNMVSSSLVQLAEKYQKLKQELLKEENQSLDE